MSSWATKLRVYLESTPTEGSSNYILAGDERPPSDIMVYGLILSELIIEYRVET